MLIIMFESLVLCLVEWYVKLSFYVMCILRLIKELYKDESGKRGQRRRGFINLLFW